MAMPNFYGLFTVAYYLLFFLHNAAAIISNPINTWVFQGFLTGQTYQNTSVVDEDEEMFYFDRTVSPMSQSWVYYFDRTIVHTSVCPAAC